MTVSPTSTVRRLPVYFIVDSSETMGHDTAMQSVQSGLRSLPERINRDGDRQTTNTLWVAVYAFDDDVRLINDLTSIVDFQPDLSSLDIPAGQTRLSRALERVRNDIQKDYRPPIAGFHGYKGDYRPLVFLLTDGEPDPPDDPWQESKRQLLEMRTPKLLRYVVVGFGDGIRDQNLYALGDRDVFHYERHERAFEDFFDWVSQSLVTASNPLNVNQAEAPLPGPQRLQTGAWRPPSGMDILPDDRAGGGI